MNPGQSARKLRQRISSRRTLCRCVLAVVLPSGSTAFAQGLGSSGAPELPAAGDLAKSAVLSGALTTGLTLAIHSARPNAGGYSWASGSSSAAFAVAPILASRYGWKASVPAYTFAVLTGFGGIEEGKHSTSNLIAGATVGLVVGSTVAHHRGPQQMMPEHLYMGKRGLGLKFGF